MTAASVLAVLGSLCFAAFAWGVVSHFVRPAGEKPRAGALAVALVGLAGYGGFIARLVLFPPAWSVAVALCAALFLTAFGLFVWAVKVTRRARLTAAYSVDRPAFLLREGPYRHVRHPFYTSYLMFWLGTALAAMSSPSGWIAFAVMAALYLDASRREEAKFAASDLAQAYAAYRAGAGRFLPRLRVERKD